MNERIPSNNDDDFIIGKGFNIAEEQQAVGGKHAVEKVKKRKSKTASGMPATVKNLIWILSIVIVSVSIALCAIVVGADYLGLGFDRGEDCVVEIPMGASTQQISEKLHDANAVKWPLVFTLYSKLKGYDSRYKYGVYNFNNEIGYEGLADMLVTDGAKANSVTVTIPEMSSIDDMAKILSEKGVCNREDFIDAVQNGDYEFDFIKDIPSQSVYYRLEGYLFPDTYDFYNYDSKECAELAVQKMLENFEAKIEFCKQDIANSKYSLHELVTMASIVELEAGGSPAEMANVAAVFFNRLESPDFQTLGSSPTRKYPHGNGRYNTYECIGLPPGPLCAPSLNSIKATVNPTKASPYYYFVTDASMKFYYRETLFEHNAIIAKLKSENNWIYED